MQTLRRKPRKALPLQDEAAEGLLDATLTLVGIAQMGTTKTGKEDWRHFLKLCISGIPLSYRSQVWSECSGVNEMAEPGRYEELLSEHNGEQNQCLTQIDLDVHRTMPTNVFFGGDGPGVPKLRRVLVAFSWYDVEIGYCQAMNNIAATLLLTEPSESKSFWLLVCLIEKIMPRDYYTSHLLTSQADQRVLIEYTGELLPKIWAHIEGLGVDLPAVTFAWFLSLYTDCLPVEVLFRVWDLLFVEGMVTLFRVALAILELHEEAILETQSAAAFYSLMHRTTGQLFHADKLVQAASTLRDRVKHTDITSRRTYHIDALRQELGL
ncbi:TBC-domain-containing protein [Tilletiaria anomala UBC 951]|uniref:TBC-domain-containing protein n=1 Tax=Tilletiaria anomala (strain ATCC 24038 / CBS 436.72 / UBC 951) TaxID=1037660 RepID=A0A066VVB2_TILAU|nr:TBC-domain-containing protein [Tilletiaria anomala UBC 951]KDN42490.1 TBC-domain-containing protein [Tilletiaria anomala UBC 951]